MQCKLETTILLYTISANRKFSAFDTKARYYNIFEVSAFMKEVYC